MEPLQPDVEEYQVRAARYDGGERVVAVARGACAIALVLQNTGDQIADIGLIVDDQNFTGHIETHLSSLLSDQLFSGRGRLGLAGGGELHAHPGAALSGNFVGGVAQLDAAAMVFDDSPDDGET